MKTHHKPEIVQDVCIEILKERNALRAEVERLNDVIKTSKVLEAFKSLEKCAKELEATTTALETERAKVANLEAGCQCPGCGEWVKGETK